MLPRAFHIQLTTLALSPSICSVCPGYMSSFRQKVGSGRGGRQARTNNRNLQSVPSLLDPPETLSFVLVSCAVHDNCQLGGKYLSYTFLACQYSVLRGRKVVPNTLPNFVCRYLPTPSAWLPDYAVLLPVRFASIN